jgi:hypothetical protein
MAFSAPAQKILNEAGRVLGGAPARRPSRIWPLTWRRGRRRVFTGSYLSGWRIRLCSFQAHIVAELRLDDKQPFRIAGIPVSYFSDFHSPLSTKLMYSSKPQICLSNLALSGVAACLVDAFGSGHCSYAPEHQRDLSDSRAQRKY